MNILDSDICDEKQFDIESDNEPPIDKLKERKLICKENLKRVYKCICKVGVPL